MLRLRHNPWMTFGLAFGLAWLVSMGQVQAQTANTEIEALQCHQQRMTALGLEPHPDCDPIIFELLRGKPGYRTQLDIHTVERLAYQEALERFPPPKATEEWFESKFAVLNIASGGIRAMSMTEYMAGPNLAITVGEVELPIGTGPTFFSAHVVEMFGDTDVVVGLLGGGVGLSLGRWPRDSKEYVHASLHAKSSILTMVGEEDFGVFSPTSVYGQLRAPLGQQVILYANAGTVAIFPTTSGNTFSLSPFLEAGVSWGLFDSEMKSRRVGPDASAYKSELAEATWSEVQRQSASSDLRLALSLNDDDTYFPDGALSDGERMQVSGSLKNTGEGIALDTTLQLECSASALLLQPEALLGTRLEPGQEVRVQLELLGTMDIKEGLSYCSVQVREGRGYHSNKVRLEVETHRKGLPTLEITQFQVIDGSSGLANGNGDGTAQNGEQLELQLLIRNRGSVPAFGLRLEAAAEGLSGALDPPLLTQTTLQPGESTLARMRLILPPTWRKEKLPLAFQVTDERTEAIVARKAEVLSVKIQESRPKLSLRVLQPASNGQSTPVELLVENQGGLKLRDVRVVLEGESALYFAAQSFQAEGIDGRSSRPFSTVLNLPATFEAKEITLTARLEASDGVTLRQAVQIPVTIQQPELQLDIRMAGQQGSRYPVAAGKPIELFLDVDNLGTRAAAEVAVLVSARAGGFRWAVAQPVGRVASGQRFSGVFRSDRIPRALAGQRLKLELSVTQETFSTLIKTIELDILEDEAEVARLQKNNPTDVQVGFSDIRITSPDAASTPASSPLGGSSSPVGQKGTPKENEAPEKVGIAVAPQTGMKRPNAIALVVAADVYSHRDLPPVVYAQNDATAIQQVLIRTLGVPADRITYLKGAQATLTAVNSWLEVDLPRMAGQEPPSVFVFFSGHGLPAPIRRDSSRVEPFLLFHDARPDAPSASGLAVSKLIEQLQAVSPTMAMVMLDACFSGGYHSGSLLTGVSGVGLRPSGPVAAPQGFHIFSATDSGQAATWYDAQQHGLFTYALLQGLSGLGDQNKDRRLTVAELNAYLTQSVPPLADRLSHRVQVPRLESSDPATLLIQFGRK